MAGPAAGELETTREISMAENEARKRLPNEAEIGDPRRSRMDAVALDRYETAGPRDKSTHPSEWHRQRYPESIDQVPDWQPRD